MTISIPRPVHRFHIPVMGTGFTIATPVRVARFGISSVVSIVDDHLIEQTRHRIAAEFGRATEAIGSREPDARARRITAYLDLLEEIVSEQVETLRHAVFEKGSEIHQYFEMLPRSPLRDLYEHMIHHDDGPEKAALQDRLRSAIRPGSIDVNIMTKLDRDAETGKLASGTKASHAMAALRGFAQSRVDGAVILSAGLNLRLFSSIGEFDNFLPDAAGRLRKRVVLKVQDLRSAAIQGKVLAKRGVWVSEFRVESGLNCGGHAFGDRGRVLGPILEEFRDGRRQLCEQLHGLTNRALRAAGRPELPDTAETRLTVQGGIGTAEEDTMLREKYGVDGTGWGSPFMMVPEVVSIDDDHLQKLADAGEDDLELSDASPLGVPFWILKTSTSEALRQAKIDAGKPGFRCTKGFLISNFDYADKGLCTASRGFQNKKLAGLGDEDLTEDQRADVETSVTAKACLCRHLAGGAEPVDETGEEVPTAVCCGPNTAYFSRIATLREMVDHIHGRIHLPIDRNRPHMFVKELRLHVEQLEKLLERGARGLAEVCPDTVAETRSNLLQAIDHYVERAHEVGGAKTGTFLDHLEDLRDRLGVCVTPTRALA